MNTLEAFSFVILCGGKSRRMGQDKGLLKIENQFLISRAAERLNIDSQKIYISTNNPQYAKLLPYAIITDVISNIGPIGGVYSALKQLATPYVFFLTCDSPEVDFGLFNVLYQHKQQHDHLILPTHQGQLEPLLGIYATALHTNLEDFIKKQKYSLYKFALEQKARIIDISTLSEKNYFVNLNTPEQYLAYLNQKNLKR